MKVLVLAGGYDQIKLIQELDSRGYEVVLVDYFENPPAKEYVSRHYMESTLDVEKVKEIAVSENVELILTACTDQALYTMAKVSEEMGLPCYLSFEQAKEVTNKKMMKEKMVQYGIPTAKYEIIKKSGDVSYDRDELDFPCIVKPVDANSSKGVKKAESMEEMPAAIKYALQFSRSGEVIVEEYIEGEELSVDAWINEGETEILCISTSVKLKENKNAFTIAQSRYPCIISDLEKENIVKIVSDIGKAFGIKNSPMLVQMLRNRSGMTVIEFSARTGGGTKYKLIEEVSGRNVIGDLVELTLGGKVEKKSYHFPKVIHMNYQYCIPGKVRRFMGFDIAKKKGYIEDYFIYKKTGAQIAGAENSSDRVSGYMVSGRDEGEAEQMESRAEKLIKVISEDGTDIKRNWLDV